MMPKHTAGTVDATPAPEFTEPTPSVPVAIQFTIRDPNTGELVSSAADFKTTEEKKIE